jgi:putative ATP-dependent endonuclease of OLD family
MRLRKVAVANHSRLVDAELEVRGHVVLVGPNDVGKSSLLRCLDLLLGASTAQLYQRIVPEDFRDADAPLVVEAELIDFSAADEALFPDEITVDGATGGKHLAIRLSATLDSAQTISIERTAPGGGTSRQLSRDQVAGLGWNLLAALGASRDLREDRRSHLQDILAAIDLGPEQADFDAITEQLQDKLGSSVVLSGLRNNLADQLNKALPDQLAADDLVFLPGAAAEDHVLNDVRLHVKKDGEPRSLSEQSDGMRALYAMALYDLVSEAANMVAIDEPEVHLHPTSQRSLARLLREGPNQKFIATHSTDIVGAFDPECVVAVRAGGVVVQPAAGFLSTDEKLAVEWWARDRLEPLTAHRIAAVEGISDRILLKRVAELTGRNLDRLGVSVVETGGSGSMGAIIKLFGKSGFDIPLSILIDADASAETAKKLGIDEADLAANGVWVSTPDLEAEYVAALGAAIVWAAIDASSLFSPNERANCATTGTGGTRTDADVAAFCGRSKYKVRAAMVVASLFTTTSASTIKTINDLLDSIAPTS